MKKGLISMTVVYTFLVLFLLITSSAISYYLTTSNMVDTLIQKAKEDIYESR